MKTGRRNGKPRRKFTKDELHVLNYTFEENPYPDFTIRKKLAEQLYCQIYVIDVSKYSKVSIYVFCRQYGKCKELRKNLIAFHHLGKSVDIWVTVLVHFNVGMNTLCVSWKNRQS